MDMQTDVRRSAGVRRARPGARRVTALGGLPSPTVPRAATSEPGPRLRPPPRARRRGVRPTRPRSMRSAATARAVARPARRTARARAARPRGPPRGRAAARARRPRRAPGAVRGRGRAHARLVASMAVQTETIQVSGIRCERCVRRARRRARRPRGPRVGEREPDGPGDALLGRRAHRSRRAPRRAGEAGFRELRLCAVRRDDRPPDRRGSWAARLVRPPRPPPPRPWPRVCRRTAVVSDRP